MEMLVIEYSKAIERRKNSEVFSKYSETAVSESVKGLPE